MKQTDWLRELLASLPPALEKPPEDDPDLEHFDPDRDDVGNVIARLYEFASSFGYGESAEALAWLEDTVDLNFEQIQIRWKEVPVVAVPQEVSDKCGLDEPRGLFGYLDQIRLAYILGADLAAIALCRVATELLIRYHYAGDVPDAQNTRKTKLTGEPGRGKLNLIAHAESRCEFLKNYNWAAKVKAASEILHNPNAGETDERLHSIEGRHRNPFRGLVVECMKVLEEMISRVP
jgi:hypothetical protein